MIDIIKLLEYNQFLRHEYLEVLKKLPWEEVVKDREASFNSLRNIYLHCVSVLDSYINHRIQGDSPKQIQIDDFDNMAKIEKHLEQIESKVNVYLSKVTPEELSRKITYTGRGGSTTTATVENILIHIFLEEIHHQGEFIALLWQMDVRPPHMGWIQYESRT